MLYRKLDAIICKDLNNRKAHGYLNTTYRTERKSMILCEGLQSYLLPLDKELDN